jgi:hypothetical protein
MTRTHTGNTVTDVQTVRGIDEQVSSDRLRVVIVGARPTGVLLAAFPRRRTQRCAVWAPPPRAKA